MNNDSKMHLAPPDPGIGDTDGFAKSDIFGHAEFGGRLVNAICSWKTPLVFALTSGWGAGKSVFAKQLAGELRKKWAETEDTRKAENAPVIYFDAFANDYQKNALFALAGEVMEFIGRRKKMAGKASESMARIGRGVGGTLAECTARFATLGAAGVGDVSEAMKTALDKRMEDAKEGREVVKEFRKALENAAKELGGQPLVFIVDELDRCRPDFALELLEKIKHLFSVPNVCFLVVTNLEQFKTVVQRTYGYSEEEARVYLDKFFHHTFRLPLSDQYPTFNVERYISHLWDVMCFPSISDDMKQYMKKIAAHHKMSLRDIEQMFACATLAQLEPGSFKNDDSFAIIAVLHALRKINPNFYGEILQGTASWDDLPPNFKASPMSSVLCWTKQHMDENEKPRFAGILRTQGADDVDGRRKLLARIATKIEQFPEL